MKAKTIIYLIESHTVKVADSIEGLRLNLPAQMMGRDQVIGVTRVDDSGHGKRAAVRSGAILYLEEV